MIGDVIRTQSRIEATLTALERLAQGELTTVDDFVPFDITELLDRAAHDALRVYPDVEVSLVPSPTVLMIGLPTGLRLVIDNAIANAVKHGNAGKIQLTVSSSGEGVEIAIDDDGSGFRSPSAPPCSNVSPAGRRRRARVPGWAWRWWPSKPNYTAAQQNCRTARWAVPGCCCGSPETGADRRSGPIKTGHSTSSHAPLC